MITNKKWGSKIWKEKGQDPQKGSNTDKNSIKIPNLKIKPLKFKLPISMPINKGTKTPILTSIILPPTIIGRRIRINSST